MIQFTVKAKNWDEESVARRVAAIIGNSTAWEKDSICPFVSEGRWQLNQGNDWHLRKMDDHMYQLRYRYLGNRPEIMEGLKLFLDFVFE